MSFCKNCHTEIREGDKFCTKCGAPVTGNDDTPKSDLYSAPQEVKNPFDKKVLIVIAVAVVLLIGVTVGGILAMNNVRRKQAQKQKIINVYNYVEFEVKGYNGQGEAAVDLDYDGLYEEVMRAVGGNKASGSKKYIYMATAAEICDGIHFKATPDKGLSNGDKVRIEMEYDGQAVKKSGLILIFEEYEEEIRNLNDVNTVDIFDYVELSFQGRSGAAWVSYENTATDRGLRDVRFTIDNNYNLSVGDEFTLSVADYFADMLLNDYGIILKSTSKTYRVERNDVDSYIESISEISEELLEEMKEYALEEIEDTYSWKWSMELSDTEYMGIYLLYPNESNSYYGNYAFVIYTGTVTFEDEDRDSVKVFLPVQVNNLINNANGSQECDSWVSLWDDGKSEGDAECTGYLSEEEMFLDIFNEENLLDFFYEISDGMRDYYDEPLEPAPL